MHLEHLVQVLLKRPRVQAPADLFHDRENRPQIVAVAFGILLDTIVVRSILVTALNLDIGRWIWWPSKLAAQPAREQAPELREPVSSGQRS